MKIKLLFLPLIFLLSTANAAQPKKDLVMREKQIHQATKEYLTFLSEIGKTKSTKSVSCAIPQCATTCKKIINGTTLFTEGSKLMEQLDAALQMVNGWSMKELNTTFGKYGDSPINMSSVTYELSTPTMGKFRTVAFLTFDGNGHITEINEVAEHLG